MGTTLEETTEKITDLLKYAIEVGVDKQELRAMLHNLQTDINFDRLGNRPDA